MFMAVAHWNVDLFAGTEKKLRLTTGAFEGEMHILEIGQVGRADRGQRCQLSHGGGCKHARFAVDTAGSRHWIERTQVQSSGADLRDNRLDPIQWQRKVIASYAEVGGVERVGGIGENLVIDEPKLV